MPTVLEQINAKYKKHAVVDVRSGDSVRVHQKIKEGSKERIQVFEGLVIRTDRKGSHTSSITVRRLASGIGVEKTYLVHSPLVTKIEITKRSKVRRKYLSYMRDLTGKSARLSGVEFDKNAVNTVPEEEKKAEVPKEESVKEEASPKVEEVVEKKEEPKVEKPQEEKTEDKKED